LMHDIGPRTLQMVLCLFWWRSCNSANFKKNLLCLIYHYIFIAHNIKKKIILAMLCIYWFNCVWWLERTISKEYWMGDFRNIYWRVFREVNDYYVLVGVVCPGPNHRPREYACVDNSKYFNHLYTRNTKT